MPRPDIQAPELAPYQRDLARMIDAALKAGQRGDGTKSQYWAPWTVTDFMKAAKCSASAIANWRNEDARKPPYNIVPLLNAFYGEIPLYEAQKEKMRRLWHAARGIPDEQTGLTAPRRLTGPSTLVHLRGHKSEPVTDSNTNHALYVSLTISPHHDAQYGDKRVTIGLRHAILRLTSDHWQPTRNGLISERGHSNFAIDAAGARIVGPVDQEMGVLNGQIVGDDAIAELEPLNNGDGPVTVSVVATESSFKVMENGDLSAEQDAVIAALLMDMLKTRDNQTRVVLESVTVQPAA